MKRLFMSITAVAVGLAAAGGLRADGKGSGHGSGGKGSGPSYSPGSSGSFRNQGSYNSSTWYRSHVSNYHLTAGKKFQYGYYYAGRSHNHWSYSCWDKRYG